MSKRQTVELFYIMLYCLNIFRQLFQFLLYFSVVCGKEWSSFFFWWECNLKFLFLLLVHSHSFSVFSYRPIWHSKTLLCNFPEGSSLWKSKSKINIKQKNSYCANHSQEKNCHLNYFQKSLLHQAYCILRNILHIAKYFVICGMVN